MVSSKCIILANGDVPSKSVMKYLQLIGYKTLICADGGANSARKLDIFPEYIVGDLDSITKENYDYFSDKCKIEKIKRQNDTDVEKCLKFALKKKIKDIVLLGATGNRLDHSLCNLGIVLKFFDQLKITIIHQQSVLMAFSGNTTINTIPGETISLYAFDEKTTITSSGLKYSLTKTKLPFGKKESTSNQALSNRVELTIKGGKIFVIRDYQTMRKNDLI